MLKRMGCCFHIGKCQGYPTVHHYEISIMLFHYDFTFNFGWVYGKIGD